MAACPVAACSLAALLIGCAADAPAPRSAPSEGGESCTSALLARFDPGMPVVARGELPTTEQVTQAQTEHLGALPCEAAESDAECKARAERESAKSYPGASSVEVAVGADREVVRARVTIDGTPGEIEAPTLLALEADLTLRRRAGATVEVIELRAHPAPDAERVAVLRVAMPGRAGRVEALRAWLEIAAMSDPVAALVHVRQRARAQRIAIHAVEPLESGATRIEIGCARAAESSAAVGKVGAGVR
jgi:hypothetical protein